MKNPLRLVAGSRAKNVWACLLLGTLLACGGPQENIPLAHPLSRRLIYFDGGEIFISAAPGVPLASLCNLKEFRNLRPGMTPEEVSHLYGPPVSEYQERGGRFTVYVFSTGEGATVEVVRLMTGSEEPLAEQWLLRHSVSGKQIEQIVAPEVLAAIPLPQRGFTLHLNSGEAGATLKFKEGRPHTFWWVGDGRPDGAEQ